MIWRFMVGKLIKNEAYSFFFFSSYPMAQQRMNAELEQMTVPITPNSDML